MFAAAALLAWKWPFSRAAVVRDVNTQVNANVEIASFQTTYFPPGYSARGIRMFDRGNANAPLLTLDNVRVRASYFDLLRLVHRLTDVQAAGLHFFALPREKPARGFLTGPPDIGHIDVNRAVFTFHSANRGQPFSLAIDRLVLDDMQRDRSFPFRGELHTGVVPGRLVATGRFGPWNWNNPASSALSGNYRYMDGRLSALKGVSGSLGSRGTFRGKLGSALIDGTAEAPDFRVASGGHPARIASVFQSNVNLTNGDAQINSIRSSLGKTEVLARGTLLGSAGARGKTLNLDLTITRGRVDDLLLLFTRRANPGMRGALTLQGHAELPPDPPAFLERLRLQGDFEIRQGYFTGEELKSRIESLSESADRTSHGAPEGGSNFVASDLRGHVDTLNGVARLTAIDLRFPGSHATLQGTFGLADRTIAMKGTLITEGKLSDAESGAKALAAKIYSVFLKKKHGATIVPFHITGTAGEPKFGLLLR